MRPLSTRRYAYGYLDLVAAAHRRCAQRHVRASPPARCTPHFCLSVAASCCYIPKYIPRTCTAQADSVRVGGATKGKHLFRCCSAPAAPPLAGGGGVDSQAPPWTVDSGWALLRACIQSANDYTRWLVPSNSSSGAGHNKINWCTKNQLHIQPSKWRSKQTATTAKLVGMLGKRMAWARMVWHRNAA